MTIPGIRHKCIGYNQQKNSLHEVYLDTKIHLYTVVFYVF